MPWGLKALRPRGITDRLAVKNMARTPLTRLANITGQPAMSVPLHWARDGLPLQRPVHGADGE